MTNEALQTTAMPEDKILSFGVRLQSARQALGLERKDIAAQLRLTEKIITMLEEDKYPQDLPTTFIRGYLRSYSKLVDIPETEVHDALAPLQPKPLVEEEPMPVPRHDEPVTSSNYFVQFVTYLIVLTVASLTGLWWYNHTTPPMTPTTQTIDTPPIADAMNNRGPRNTSDISQAQSNDIAQIANQDATALAAAEAAANTQLQANNVPVQSNTTAIAPVVKPVQQPQATHKYINTQRNSEMTESATNTQAPDYLARKNKLDSFVTSNSDYNSLTALSDLLLFAVVSLFAIWWHTPAAKRRVAMASPKASVIRKFPTNKSNPRLGKVVRTSGMVVSGLWQDISSALMTKRALISLSALGVIAIGIIMGNTWWHHKQNADQSVMLANKPAPLPTRMEVITNHQLNVNPTMVGLSSLNPPTDGAFNNLNPQMQTGKIVEYVKNPPADAMIATQQADPAPKIVARKKFRTHHSVPAYMQAEQNDADNSDSNNDSSDE